MGARLHLDLKCEDIYGGDAAQYNPVQVEEE
jgi:hypothetical protein